MAKTDQITFFSLLSLGKLENKMQFKKMLESESQLTSEQRTKLAAASKEKALKLIYEWTKTGVFDMKQFTMAINTYICTD